MYANIAAAIKATRSQALATALTANNGTSIAIYTGAYPASPAAAVPTGSTLLVKITYTAATFCSEANGVISVNASSPFISAAAGSPGWARISDGGGNVVMDMDAGTNGTSLTLSQAQVASGYQYQITGGTITEA